MLGSAKSKHPKLTNGEKYIGKIPAYVITIVNVTDGQTDGRLCHSNTALCVASRVKNESLLTDNAAYQLYLGGGKHEVYRITRCEDMAIRVSRGHMEPPF